MQLKITSEFIDKTAAQYGNNFKGGYAYSTSLIGLMKTYVLLANDEEIIVVQLGLSGEPKSDTHYQYNQLNKLTIKSGMLTRSVIIQPSTGKKIKLTIPKKTIGIVEYQSRLIELLETKAK